MATGGKVSEVADGAHGGESDNPKSSEQPDILDLDTDGGSRSPTEIDVDERSSQIESEMAKYKARKEHLEQLLKLKSREASLANLKGEVHDLEKSFPKLSHKSSSKKIKKFKHTKNKRGKKSQKHAPHQISTSSESDSDAKVDKQSAFNWEYSSSSSEVVSEKSKGRKKVKSGLEAKSSPYVLDEQLFPHVFLQFEYVSESVKFKDLELHQFVAGECEIMTSNHVSEAEIMGRLFLLKKMFYYAGIYQWPALLDFYAAVLRRIELRQASWSSLPDHISEIAHPILARALLQDQTELDQSVNSSDMKFDSRVYFCSEFNRGMCTENKSHSGEREGREVIFRHICAQCWLKDHLQNDHTERDSNCPRKIPQVENVEI
jgi:hypothetical protein